MKKDQVGSERKGRKEMAEGFTTVACNGETGTNTPSKSYIIHAQSYTYPAPASSRVCVTTFFDVIFFFSQTPFTRIKHVYRLRKIERRH